MRRNMPRLAHDKLPLKRSLSREYAISIIVMAIVLLASTAGIVYRNVMSPIEQLSVGDGHVRCTGKRDIMRTLPFVFAIVSFLVAVVVFIFAGGVRAIYSGLFFVLIGGVLLVNARQKAQK